MRRSFFRASGGACFLFWAHSLVFLPEFTVSIFYAIMKDTGKGRRTSEDSMEKKKFAAAITDLLLALIGCLFILSASVVLVLNIRVIYYHDIDTLHLTKEVDLTKEQIRENYDALIDYNPAVSRFSDVEAWTDPFCGGAADLCRTAVSDDWISSCVFYWRMGKTAKRKPPQPEADSDFCDCPAACGRSDDRIQLGSVFYRVSPRDVFQRLLAL